MSEGLDFEIVGTPHRPGRPPAGVPASRSREGPVELGDAIEALVDVALVALDPRGTVTMWGRGAERLTGYSRNEMIGRPLGSLSGFEEVVRQLHAQPLTISETTRCDDAEIRLVHKNGRPIWTRVVVTALQDRRARLRGFAVVIADLGEAMRQRRRDVLLAVGRVLDQNDDAGEALPRVLEVTLEGTGLLRGEMWNVDRGEGVLRLRQSRNLPGVDEGPVGESAHRLSIVRGRGLLGRVWKTRRHVVLKGVMTDGGIERANALKALGARSAVAVPVESRGEVVGALAFFHDGSEEPEAELVELLVDVGRTVGRFRERVDAEDALSRLGELAATDSLTGLRNRREFDRMLRTIPRQPFAILAIDVDHLKHVNDDHGHQAGDALLHTVGTTLSLLLRGWDAVARVGGDEFAAILIGIDADQASHVAERMRTAMHIVPVPSGRAQISVGWAAAPAGADPATVWALADDCLYEAKKAGRDRVVGRTYLGADGPHQSTPSYTELLSQVLEGRRIHSMYQPILDMEDGAIIGYEALARPEGFAPTDSVEGLFDMARRSGRMRELDWLCRRVAIEQAAGLPAGSLLFLNTSGVLLLDPLHDVDQMLLLLEAAGRSPSTVVLEITERDNVRDLERLAAVMKVHRDAGLAFALDDVGEGHSTIELLATAGAEYLKVGRSLTMTASRGRSRSAIEATLAFAHTTRAHVIAEGVENEFASDQMRDLDIRLGQGFGLGLPVEAGEVIDTMADWRTRAALSPLRPRSLEPGQST